MSLYPSTSTLYSLVSSLYSHISLYPSTYTLYFFVSSLYSHISPYASTYTLYSLVTSLYSIYPRTLLHILSSPLYRLCAPIYPLTLLYIPSAPRIVFNLHSHFLVPIYIYSLSVEVNGSTSKRCGEWINIWSPIHFVWSPARVLDRSLVIYNLHYRSTFGGKAL